MPKINVNRKQLDTLEVPEKYHKRMEVVVLYEFDNNGEMWCRIGEDREDEIFCYIPKSWLKINY